MNGGENGKTKRAKIVASANNEQMPLPPPPAVLLTRRSLSPQPRKSKVFESVETSTLDQHTKVSLIQNRLLTKANRSYSDLTHDQHHKVQRSRQTSCNSASRFIHTVRRSSSTNQLQRLKSPSPLHSYSSAELLSPRVVKKALMGNVLKLSNSKDKQQKHQQEHKIQVKLEVTKPQGSSGGQGPSTSSGSFRKTKEILTLKAEGSHSPKKSKEKKNSPKNSSKLPKSVKISNTVSVQNGSTATVPLNQSNGNGNGQPVKPPRKSKSFSSSSTAQPLSSSGMKERVPTFTQIQEKTGSNSSKKSGSSQRHSGYIVSPPPPNQTPSTSRPESPRQFEKSLRNIFTKSRSASRSPTPTSTTGKSNGVKKSPSTSAKGISTINKTLSEGLSRIMSARISKTASSDDIHANGNRKSGKKSTTLASTAKEKEKKNSTTANKSQGSNPNLNTQITSPQRGVSTPFTVTQKPLAPPAESRPIMGSKTYKNIKNLKSDLSYVTLPLVRRYHHHLESIYSSSPSLCSYASYKSLPTLTPYLTETKRVTNSVFLTRTRTRSPSPVFPRPTKTSLMREIISREPSSSLNFKDSTFKRTSSMATLENSNISAISATDLALGFRPRQRRRRSVSCLNLKDYTQYILQLRHSHRNRSPRFSRLHKLYSSLDRLCQLERSTTSLYDIPVLSAQKRNDFDAWWKVRNRLRIEEEMNSLSRELLQAQSQREFFFRPKIFENFRWHPVNDSHLRFKKWSVEELKAFLMEGEFPREKLTKSDLYKTHWRGVSVKELALNLEVNELYKKSTYGRSGVLHDEQFYESKVHYLRRAFSMSSTLSEEQREGIKKRIGHLITTAKLTEEDRRTKHDQSPRTVTSRMGFTLSSDPKNLDDLGSYGRLKNPDTTGASALTESKKKEMSQKISEEFKERKVKETNLLRGPFNTSNLKKRGHFHDNLPISTKIALRKAESLNLKKIPKNTPFYSVYCKDGVNNKIKAFEQTENSDLKHEPRAQERIRKPIVHIVTPTPSKINQSGDLLSKSTLVKETVGSTSLPPFRSNSPLLRSPSPTRGRRSVSPMRASPTLSKEYVSHINIISKLASLLLKRNTSLKNLVTREVLERDKLERLRSLNCGEVERLRDFFEDKHSFDEFEVRSPEINLLRCLFCSDSNLAKITEKLDTDHRRRCASASGSGAFGDIDGTKQRAAPDGSSPTPTQTKKSSDLNLNLGSKGGSGNVYLNTRSRKPIYQPSSIPNVCQPTLTAHCYLTQTDSLERVESPELYGYTSDYNTYDSLPHSYTYSYSSPAPSSLSNYYPPPNVQTNQIQQSQRVSRVLDERINPPAVKGYSYSNYDPAAHQPRYRYVPKPPVIPIQQNFTALTQRSGSSMGCCGLPQQQLYNKESLKRSESFHSTMMTRRVHSPPYQGYPYYQRYPHQWNNSTLNQHKILKTQPRQIRNEDGFRLRNKTGNEGPLTVAVQKQSSNFARIASLKKSPNSLQHKIVSPQETSV